MEGTWNIEHASIDAALGLVKFKKVQMPQKKSLSLNI